MKNNRKSILAVLIAALLVIGIGTVMSLNTLKASEDDGTNTAAEQQEQEKEEDKVTVEVPKQEEPVIEMESESVQTEENAAEEQAEENTETAEETAAPEAEATPAPETAEGEAEESAEETEPAMPQPTAEIEMENDGSIHYGDTVKLHANVAGIDKDYTVQWQYNDGTGWKDLDANGDDYSFTADENSVEYSYRVIVNY